MIFSCRLSEPYVSQTEACPVLPLRMHTILRCDSRAYARLAAVHLVDAHLASDPAKYLAAALVSLSAMLHLELPHINVLSKVRRAIPDKHPKTYNASDFA